MGYGDRSRRETVAKDIHTVCVQVQTKGDRQADALPSLFIANCEKDIIRLHDLYKHLIRFALIIVSSNCFGFEYKYEHFVYFCTFCRLSLFQKLLFSPKVVGEWDKDMEQNNSQHS